MERPILFAVPVALLLFPLWLTGGATSGPSASAQLSNSSGFSPAEGDSVPATRSLDRGLPADPFADLPVELARELPALPGTLPPGLGARPHPYSRRVRAFFRVRVRDVVIPYRVLAITAVPGERIALEVTQDTPFASRETFRLRAPTGEVGPDGPGRWHWTAPGEPGPVPLRIESPALGDAILLNVLVLHPFEEIEGGMLNGYRIGAYRVGPGRSEPPRGFVEATDDVLDLRVAPGFTLGQFVSHQPGDPPYLALSEPLLLKLEAILEEVRAQGARAETLELMSAFRTPHYNRAIGNTTDGSRHLWGDAADVYLAPDGWMSEARARELYQIVEQVERRGEAHVAAGGLSLYRGNAARGPFVHVDARGKAVRW